MTWHGCICCAPPTPPASRVPVVGRVDLASGDNQASELEDSRAAPAAWAIALLLTGAVRLCIALGDIPPESALDEASVE
ncbi:hypothetical protein ACWEJ6_49595 [Nonomuraea sp. NPDC004702]